MSNYWSWRTYKHQQGSLVWKPNVLVCRTYWLMWFFAYPIYYKDQISFKVID